MQVAVLRFGGECGTVMALLWRGGPERWKMHQRVVTQLA